MQSSIIEFLSDPMSYGSDVTAVDRIETHISQVFLAGRKAYKLKRAVALPYLDFSTLALREQACRNEVRLNQRTAPEIYLGVKPITKNQHGQLALGGQGEVVDWVVEMIRFDGAMLMDKIALQGSIDGHVMAELAAEIFAFHQSEQAIIDVGGADQIAAIIANNALCFKAYGRGILAAKKVAALNVQLQAMLARHSKLLDQRQATGQIRHCHGDLHLGNIVLLAGKPVLFDAIEFNDEFAIIDVMYDLAFLLMDLAFQGLADEANILLNRYVELSSDASALAVLPLFLSLRASIRSHVAALANAPSEAVKYLDFAAECLAAAPPRLVAIGGFSGTGKSSVARSIAAKLSPLPGALILRSDVIRKQIAGVDQYAKLPEEAYSADMTRQTYQQIYDRAASALKAGHSVIADAVFAGPAERQAIGAVAAEQGVAFDGIWLEATAATAAARISQRINDASDATTAVLEQQLGYDIGVINWRRVASGNDLASVSRATLKSLQLTVE